MAEPEEIIKSKVSVYEIELDLTNWKFTHTSQLPGFHDALIRFIPSLMEHKCMSGKPGGFSLEMKKGTNFAHVIEHVILELLSLSDPNHQSYTGWTRERNRHPIYVIHYSAPDFLTGRLAAILGVDLVKKLIDNHPMDIGSCIDLLKNPLQYFTREGHEILPGAAEPLGVIQEIEDVFPRPAVAGISLSEEQVANIRAILAQIRKHINWIGDSWRRSFLEFGGNFGRAIIDKVELLNIDRFMDFLVAGNFPCAYRGIRNVSQVVNSYRIPLNFVVYSIWLYKQRLLAYLIEEYQDNRPFLERAIEDFESFFQVILQNTVEGFSKRAPIERVAPLTELKEFREIHERKGYILVIDDDEMTRSAFRDILEYNGYWVIQAKDGMQAMDIIAKRSGEISLAILDLYLPDMRGEEIYIRLKELRPDVRVLIMTAYSVSRELKEAFSEDQVEFLYKPFTAEALLKKVRLLLDRMSAS